MQYFKTDHIQIAYQEQGNPQSPLKIIWAHGWGQDHTSLMPLAQSLQSLGHHIIIDAPGFGQSPIPFADIKDSWGSREYADAFAIFIQNISPNKPIIWIGHSFGCRIATQLGAHHSNLIKAMVYIAGAGLKKKRTLYEKIIIKTKIAFYKLGKHLKKIPTINKWAQNKKLGSTDYQNAGPMRGTLVKVVNEHLSTEAKQIQCPVLLCYGEEDTETPPQIGYDYKALISNAQLLHLEGIDHYTILTAGAAQISAPIKKFILKNKEA